MKIKLSSEFVQVLGDLMPEFTTLCRLGYLAVRKHWRQVPLRPPGPFPPPSLLEMHRSLEASSRRHQR